MVRRITIKSATEIAKKWADVTPARASYYETEAPAAAAEWEANTIAAGGTYKAGIAVAGIEKRFVGGVKRAGAAKFERKVKSVGVGRYSPGVAAAEEDMAKGFADYQAVLDGLEIPDRGPRGRPANYEIGKKIGDALHKKRLAVLAATA
ncbi:hypothetical protein ES707_18157 [subsurface metagenome]